MANTKFSLFTEKLTAIKNNDYLVGLNSEDANQNMKMKFSTLLASISDFASTIRTEIDTYSTAEVDALTASSVSVKTADYTSLDADGINHVVFDFSAGNKKMLNYTTPALANNLNRKIKISTYGDGILKINREGASNILFNGNSLTATYLYCSGNFIEISGSSLGWIVTGHKIYIETSWLYNTDQSNDDYGLKTVTYDGKVGTFAIGERVTINGVVDAGIIIADSGTVLTLYACTNAQNGQFTNDWTIVGAQSGTTANVNGTNTNTFASILHNWGLNAVSLDYKLFINTSASFTNSIEIGTTFLDGANMDNVNMIQDSTSAVHLQTGNIGLRYARDADGATVVYSTSNIYIYLRLYII